MLLKNFFFLFLSFLMLIIGILISVAFLVVLERKSLSYIQNRKGPNKVMYMGIFQPFSDAIKLFLKENVKLIKTNFFIYYVSPMVGFFMAFIFLLGFPVSVNFFSMNLYLLFMMSCLSIGVYVILMSSWSSNSNYSMLGGLRSVSQSLSYEVSMFLIFFSLFLYVESFSLNKFLLFQEYLSFFYINFLMVMMIFISMVAELSRMPFDTIEGESELVSGFNVEYMSGSFTLIFLFEYIMILNMGILFIYLFYGVLLNVLMGIIMVLIFSLLIIFIRGVLPRIRYDNLMYFCWYYLLSLGLLNFLMIYLLKNLMYLLF